MERIKSPIFTNPTLKYQRNMENKVPNYDEFLNENETVNEKESWPTYLKLLGYSAKAFKKLDPWKYKLYQKIYKEWDDVGGFEQNHLEDLEREINKIELK